MPTHYGPHDFQVAPGDVSEKRNSFELRLFKLEMIDTLNEGRLHKLEEYDRLNEWVTVLTLVTMIVLTISMLYLVLR